jgi:hypothetical protein
MSTEITITSTTIDINVTESPITIEAPSGAYPLPSSVYSVFGRTGNIIAAEGDYTLTQLAGVTITSPISGQALVYNGTSWVNNTETFVGTVTSVAATVPTGLTITGSPITTSGTLAFGLQTGYSIPTNASQTTWDTAYSRSLTSAAVTGTTTKTLTLNQQSGGTITASWNDLNTDAVTSVFGRTGAVVSATGDYTTSQVTEGSNLYFTNLRAQSAITLTTTGTSGAATYSSGVLNIPQYQGGVTSFNTRTGAIVPTEGDYSLTQLSDVTLTSPSTNQVLKYNGTQWVNSSDSGLTSVDITMPSAFLVANSPLTSNGTIAVTGAGTTSQYVRGDGSLATYNPGTGGGGASQAFYFNGSVASGVTGYQQMSTAANTGASSDFSVSANGYIASFLTDSDSPNQLLIPAGNWNFEIYMNANSNAGNPYFYVELYKYNGTTFTLISSSVANPEYITNGTQVDLYTTALTVPQTTLLVTDRLAIRVYVNVSGRTITMHTQDSNLSEVITTFTTGITALNGLTAQVQNFATGTSGTDFNISSVTSTHTFNIPTASASNRGLLSTSDWTTFNNKQSALTNPITGTGTAGQIGYFNGTTSLTSSSTFTFTPTSQLLVNNSITAASAIARGTNLTPTLTASANGDVLVGLDIAPTFTVGSFTGTTSAALRVGGIIMPNANAVYNIGTNSFNFSTIYVQNVNSTGGLNINSGGSAQITAGSALGLKASNNTLFTNNNIQNAQVFSTGNWLLQQGGTFTDAGYKLDVAGTTRLNGLQTFVGTTASDGGQLGSELAAVTGSGTNWTLAGTNLNVGGYTHTTGSTTALTTSLAAVSGNSYQIVYTITGRTAGTIIISFGGTSTGTQSVSGTFYNRTSSTSVLIITPTTDFDGTVVISVKQITAGSATTTFQNSSATANIEVRASGVSTTNTFIGLSSGRYNVTGGTQNTSLGSGALASVLQGNNNTAIGYNAGQNITTGGSNTLIGSNAGQSIIFANNNTLIGQGAGQSIASASGTTIVGSAAGIFITSNPYNTLIGSGAGSTITGASNTALGYQALNGSGSSSGGSNVALGYQAGFSISSGGSNVLVGTSAGVYLTSGGNNTIIGNNAGRFLLAQTAGTSLTTNNNSVFIGTDTRSAAQGASNEVVIAGYNNTVGQVGYGSNTTVIGNNLTTNTAIQGNLTLGSLNPVSIGLPVATPSTSGGTLAAGTYYYQIVTVDIYGNTTTGSQEISATTTGTTSSIGLTWTAVTGAASYRIYRGTATNAQNVYYTSATNSFTDINGTSTAGTIPISNTTYLTRLNSAGSSVLGGTVNIGTNTSVASAALQIASTTQGFLPPVMTTTQKNAISSPATGLIVFDTTLGKLCVFATTWQTITSV